MFVIEPCPVQRFTAVTHPAEIGDGCLSFIGILQQDMGPQCGSDQFYIVTQWDNGYSGR